MVIRRIREHVAAHDWFAVAVDVGIVVLGVFIGTQVSNWNAERIERDRAAQYRDRLIGELDFNARQYALQAAYYRQTRAYGLDALAAIEGGKVLPDRDFVIAAYQLTQTDATKAKTGVYGEMIASGLGSRLGDDETQQIASDFYLTADVVQRLLETAFPYRTQLREVMPYEVQVKVRTACGDRTVHYAGRVVGIRLVVPCPVILGSKEAANAARIVRETPEIRRQMTRYIASLDEKLDNLELAHDQAAAFRRRLVGASKGGAT